MRNLYVIEVQENGIEIATLVQPTEDTRKGWDARYKQVRGCYTDMFDLARQQVYTAKRMGREWTEYSDARSCALVLNRLDSDAVKLIRSPGQEWMSDFGAWARAEMARGAA